MRKLITLSGLTLFALATTARAQEAAPAATTPATPAGATAPSNTAPVTSPADLAASAAASTTAEAVEVPAARKKMQVGLAFLPMALGKYTQSPDLANVVTSDASFAYGIGVSFGYEVLPHLIVGIAPQYILNVKEKAPDVAYDAQKQMDLLARVAYVLPVADNTSVYAEVLPGLSIIEADAKPMGFVIAGGVGAIMDLSDRFFLNLGVGYQKGFQSWSEGKNTYQTRTQYVRVSMGGGVKF